VKLLLDASLSPRLVGRLADLFPEMTHVFDSGLVRFTPDTAIWEYAARNGFTIMTTDADFVQPSHDRGFPPKVVRIEKAHSGLPRRKN
jgi:predicted nuclease of predicted toxin-antitoxin system